MLKHGMGWSGTAFWSCILEVNLADSSLDNLAANQPNRHALAHAQQSFVLDWLFRISKQCFSSVHYSFMGAKSSVLDKLTNFFEISTF